MARGAIGRSLLVGIVALALGGCETASSAGAAPLLVASDLDNPPFAWVDERGEPRGRDVGNRSGKRTLVALEGVVRAGQDLAASSRRSRTMSRWAWTTGAHLAFQPKGVSSRTSLTVAIGRKNWNVIGNDAAAERRRPSTP